MQNLHVYWKPLYQQDLFTKETYLLMETLESSTQNDPTRSRNPTSNALRKEVNPSKHHNFGPGIILMFE